MLIIIEGPDRVGKTTLVLKLADALKSSDHTVNVWHRGPPTQHPLDEYERPLWNYRPGSGVHIICDRWHIGEYVYPRVLDRPTAMDDAVWHHIELFLMSRGALLVTMVGDPDELSFRIDSSQTYPDDAKDNWQIQHRWKIRDHFERGFRLSGLPKLSVLGTNTAKEPDVSEIIERARPLEETAARISEWETYIGHDTPGVLLLGERRGTGDNPEGPAFGPYPGTSGRYLLNSLATLPYLVRDVGLANACEEPRLFGMWTELGCPPVVALGRDAARCINQWPEDRRPYPVAEVPHPQWVRRFQHVHVRRYASLIWDSIGKNGRQSWGE